MRVKDGGNPQRSGSSLNIDMGLQSLERRLERMVDGVFSRRARNSLKPIELGRRIIRIMDDQRTVDVKGRRVVPNSSTSSPPAPISPGSPTSIRSCVRS